MFVRFGTNKNKQLGLSLYAGFGPIVTEKQGIQGQRSHPEVGQSTLTLGRFYKCLLMKYLNGPQARVGTIKSMRKNTQLIEHYRLGMGHFFLPLVNIKLDGGWPTRFWSIRNTPSGANGGIGRLLTGRLERPLEVHGWNQQEHKRRVDNEPVELREQGSRNLRGALEAEFKEKIQRQQDNGINQLDGDGQPGDLAIMKQANNDQQHKHVIENYSDRLAQDKINLLRHTA